MAILTVGSGKQFTSIAGAINAAAPGDTIDVSAGTYTDDFAAINKTLTIEAVGGRVEMKSSGDVLQHKGMFILDSDSAPTNQTVTISGFDFIGATSIYTANAAGIRMFGGNLVLNNDGFFNNDEGILTNPDTPGHGTVTITNSEFANNGYSGQEHNVYIGNMASFTFQGNFVHGTMGDGNEVKTRALDNTITGNRIFDNLSKSSWSIDLSNGGNATIQNNVIQQGPNGDNYHMISYAPEGASNPGTHADISKNTIVSDQGGVFLYNASTAANVVISGNQFWGIDPSNDGPGPTTVSGNTTLAARPTLDMTSPLTTPGGGPATIALTGVDLGVVSTDWHIQGAGDLTGDHKADILWRNDNGDIVSWNAKAGPTGSFVGQFLGNNTNDWHISGLADFNGDGTSDPLWRNDSGYLYIYGSVPGASVSFTGINVGPLGNEWHVAGEGDFTGDGKADILLRQDNGDTFLFNSTGTVGAFTGQDIGLVPNDWHIQAVADFNGDHKSDILWRNDNGDVDLYNSTPGSGVSFTGQDLGIVTTSQHVVGAGDFNGDGRADIVWQSDTGDVNIWKSAAVGSFVAQDFGVSPTSWHAQGVADFSGDGLADILWRNDSGAVALWASS